MQTPHDSLDDPKIAQQPVKLWKKVVPLAIIFFLSSFNLTILQALKDAIVVTTSGAEALPFLASFVVLPASIAFFAYYSKILTVLPKQRVYYLAILPFVLFYVVFAAFVYPVSDALHFHGLFNQVRLLLPAPFTCYSALPVISRDAGRAQPPRVRRWLPWCRQGCTASSGSSRTGHSRSSSALPSSGAPS